MSRQRPLHKLSPRHHTFIHNIVVKGMPATDSYKASGFKGKYPEKTACHLTEDPLIKEEMRKTAERMRLERHEIELEYSNMIRSGQIKASDKATFMRDYGKLRGWTSDSKEDSTSVKLISFMTKALEKLPSINQGLKSIDYDHIEAEFELMDD